MKFKVLLLVIFSFAVHTLSSRDSLTLYLFILDDCIICQSYTPKINQLHAQYGDEIIFMGIFPNFSSKPEKIASFKEKYHIYFETKSDYWKTLTHKFGVVVTPEVVLYDESKETILYKGRIDNEFASLGKRRRVVTTDELAEVLAMVHSGQKTPFPFTEAVGCFINQNDPIK